MAFKMNRPVIKGTPLHKASIAKATSESIVTQTRTQADGTLVAAAGVLGKSYIPAAIDFSQDNKAIKIPKNKKKKKEKIDRSDEKTATKIESGIRPSETKEQQLAQASATTSNKESADRFEQAAKEFGYDTSTLKGYRQAEKAMEYNDTSNKWINPKVTATDVKTKEVKKTKGELAIEAEVMKNQKRALQQEKSRAQEERANKLDKAIADRNIKVSNKENVRLKKQAEVNNKNEAIRERNAARKDFKGKTNQPKSIDDKVAAMREIKAAQQAELNNDPIYIPEQDDLEPREIATQNQKNLNYNTPQNQVTQTDTEQTLTPRQAREKKLADKKYNDPNIGPKVKEQMIKEGYNPIQSKSPAQMRDDRIYRNARADGPVRKNMIKSGYTPQ